MTTNETSTECPDGRSADCVPLELLVDGDRWTAVPTDRAREERLTEWITVERKELRALEASR